MKTLDDLLGEGVSGRRVLVRADLNVPFDKADPSRISDDGRIRAVLPTLITLRDAGARVIVCSHLGRPKGAPDPKFTLAPVAARLGELLGSPVVFASDTVGADAAAKVGALTDGWWRGRDSLIVVYRGEAELFSTQRAAEALIYSGLSESIGE